MDPIIEERIIRAARGGNMNPYIVTTKRQAWRHASPVPDEAILSRRAAATLEEYDLGSYNVALINAGERITVGPLPGRTVIEVEQTTWVRLVMDVRSAASHTGGRDGLRVVEASQGDSEAQREILDAFNARRGRR